MTKSEALKGEISAEEHRRLRLAKTEAKYEFIKEVLGCAESLSDKYAPELAVTAGFFEIAGPIIKEIKKLRGAHAKT